MQYCVVMGNYYDQFEYCCLVENNDFVHAIMGYTDV